MKSESLIASSLQTTDHWLDGLSQDMNWTKGVLPEDIRKLWPRPAAA